MLVYAKNPKGIIYINNQPIYGREDGHGPTEIPFEVYNQCLDAIEDATLRESYLREKFGWNKGEIAFTYNELKWFPEESLRDIAKGMGIDESKYSSHKSIVDAIKLSLRNII